MQAVILAAGQSSRFYPFNDIHKSMFKIMGKPILEYTINGLKKCGIKDLILVVDESGVIQNYFNNSEKLGVSITYVVQPEPIGAGNAVLLSEKYIKEDFLMLNGTHVDIEEFTKDILGSKENSEAVLLVKEKENTWDCGVIRTKEDRVEDLIEKPSRGEEPSKLCVLGIYLLGKKFLKELKDTPLEHYQLESAISSFAKKEFVKMIKTKKESVTLKYPWDVLSLKDYLLRNQNHSINKKSIIEKSAEIIGNVAVEEGVVISNGAKIKGPCYLGKRAYVGDNAVIRGGTVIEENSVIGANMEIKNSILMANSKTHSGFIGDSVIGENCRIGAQFCTSNLRLDRGSVKVSLNNKKIDTGLKFLGAIVGNNVHIGIKSSIMPGIIIGNDSIIGPSTTVLQNIPENTKYYTKFQEVVSRKIKSKIVLFDIDYTMFDTDLFKKTQLQEYVVYKEVRKVLSELEKIAQLGIFSEGKKGLQKMKLLRTDIKKYFKKKHIYVSSKKEEQLQSILSKYKNEETFLVDDKLTVLYQAKKLMPFIFTIWVKRGIYAQNQKEIHNFSPDATVGNLRDIIPFIKNF